MAELLFTGGRVFTGTGETDSATAFRVVDGAFAWVGDDEHVRGERSVDLGGRTVVPGFIDSHTHPAVMTAKAGAAECFPPAVLSVEGLVELLRSHADRTPDGWILGNGYDETKFPGGHAPTAHDLDRVSSTRPVLVWRCDSHSAVCNGAALRLAGIDATTPDPPGARFERDADGVPTGVLTEIAAVQAVSRLVPSASRDEQIDALVAIGERFASHGITAVCDLMATAIDAPLEAFRTAAGRGLRQAVALYLGWNPAAPLADLDEADRTGRVRVAGVKVVLDGAFSNRTAWVHEPYPGSCDHGLHAVPDEDVRAAADWARRNGVQLAIHAMGDRALDRVVDLFGDDDPWLQDRPSIRIEHATLATPERLDRLSAARVGFGIATHTIFLFAEYDGYARNLPQARLGEAYPVRALYEGLPALALSSDCPATAWAGADDVFVSVEAAVRRRAYNGADIGQDAAVSVEQALLLYTGRAARLSPLTGVGTIAPGEEASFVVLEDDILSVPDDEISRVRIAETWMAGERVFAARG